MKDDSLEIYFTLMLFAYSFTYCFDIFRESIGFLWEAFK